MNLRRIDNLRIYEGWVNMRRIDNLRIYEGWEEMRRMIIKEYEKVGRK